MKVIGWSNAGCKIRSTFTPVHCLPRIRYIACRRRGKMVEKHSRSRWWDSRPVSNIV